jgi:hypothetical protein
VFVDEDRKKWYDFPPANYAPHKFVEEWIARSHRMLTAQQKLLDSLNHKLNEQTPSYVEEYIKVERKSGINNPFRIYAFSCVQMFIW